MEEGVEGVEYDVDVNVESLFKSYIILFCTFNISWVWNNRSYSVYGSGFFFLNFLYNKHIFFFNKQNFQIYRNIVQKMIEET